MMGPSLPSPPPAVPLGLLHRWVNHTRCATGICLVASPQHLVWWEAQKGRLRSQNHTRCSAESPWNVPSQHLVRRLTRAREEAGEWAKRSHGARNACTSSRRYANPWMCPRPSGMTAEDKLANGYCLRANGLRANRMSRRTPRKAQLSTCSPLAQESCRSIRQFACARCRGR